MNTQQLDTAMNLIESLILADRISRRESWEIEGAIIDIYNEDGDDFLNSLDEKLHKISIEILKTIGFAS
jgi:hypothetical protein